MDASCCDHDVKIVARRPGLTLTTAKLHTECEIRGAKDDAVGIFHPVSEKLKKRWLLFC